jgi:hypothetical protein
MNIEIKLTAEEYHKLLLRFIGSLTLADHMGDVADDVNKVLKELELEVEWDDWSELQRWLAVHNVTTLYNTSLQDDGDDDLKDYEV